MRMVPGSHGQGQLNHEDVDDDTSVLYRGHSVLGVAEENAVMCPLRPGQASFHRGWTLHASMPNNTANSDETTEMIRALRCPRWPHRFALCAICRIQRA